MEAQQLIEDRIIVPAGSHRLDRDALGRLRAALASVERAGDLERAAADGHRALKAWRGRAGERELERLVREATTFARRLAWALDVAEGERDAAHDRPDHVLLTSERLDDPTLEPRRHLPADHGPEGVASRVVLRDLLVAERIHDATGRELALRWLRTARARWWPDEDTQAIVEVYSEAARAAETRERVDHIAELAIDAFDGRLTHALVAALRRSRTRGRLVERLAAAYDHLAPQSDMRDRLQVLRVLLATPRADFAIPAAPRAHALMLMANAFTRANPRWSDAMLPAVPDWLEDDRAVDSWIVALPASLAREVVARWPVPHPGSAEWRPQDLRRYLDLLDGAGDFPDGPRARWLRQQWVADILAADVGSGALGMLVAASHAVQGAEEAARALVVGLLPGRSDLHAALRRWGRPTTGRTDLAEVARETAIDAELLLEYLHHKREAGLGEELPKAVTKLAGPDDADRQLEAIERLLAQAGDATRRQELEQQRARLADPEVRAGRREGARRQAVNGLVRAIAELRLQSLRRLLEDAARDSLPEAALRRGLPLGLLADLAWLGGDPDVDADLLRRFTRDVDRGTSAHDWPENQAWAGRARAVFDVDAWLAGFDETRTLADGGSTVRYFTEREPVRAIHMGTWFDTCLSIRDGFNRFAALVNAVEANRHVVYGLDAAGNIVARKLLAVTATGALLGYNTYAHADQARHKELLDDVCAAFARRCGLTLGQTGQPESITGAGWYDDGCEAWRVTAVGQPDSARERDRLGDAEAQEVAATTEDADLLAGLWLDGRLDRREVLARRLKEHEDPRIGALALADPDGFAAAASWVPASKEGAVVVCRLEPDAIAGAARVDPDLGHALRLALPADRAVAYVAGLSRAARFPAPALIRALRRAGARDRRLREAVRRGLGDSIHHPHADYVQDLRAAALGDAALRRLLRATDARTAARAARELTLRHGLAVRRLGLAPRRPGHGGADTATVVAEAVRAAAARRPQEPAPALAAVALGHPDAAAGRPPGWAHGCRPDLVRLAVAAGLDAQALHGAEESAIVHFGHPGLVPEGTSADAVALHRATARLQEALEAFVDGDAEDLRDIAGQKPQLLGDQRVEVLVTTAYVDADQDRLARLVDVFLECSDPQAYQWSGIDSGRVARVLFTGATVHDALDTDTAARVARLAAGLEATDDFVYESIVATLADFLPAHVALEVLTSSAAGPLGWALARLIRDDRAILRAAGSLDEEHRKVLDTLLDRLFVPDEAMRLRDLASG